MTDISLISSFYRAEAHLPLFFARARTVAAEVRAAGVTLEFVIVANDVQPDERRHIDAFAAAVPDVRVLYVERESLYASWNRGVEAASGAVLGFWNADDARTSAALLDGLQRIRDGCALVYFAYEIHHNGKVRVFAPTPADAELHRRRMQAGPFFLFRRDLYTQVGRFDARFRVVGDWEWAVRALAVTTFCHSPVIAGQFYIHGDNLSNTGSARERVELNVVRLLTRRYDDLTPTPPDAMRDGWQAWSAEHPLPADIEARLWGEGAQAAWERWQEEEPARRRAARQNERLRAIPKLIIDRLGLRPLLVRAGLVKARKPI